MKDILLEHGGRYVECEIDGLEFTYTYSDTPKRHNVLILRNESAYARLKNKIHEIYESFEDRREGYDVACELLLETAGRDEFFTDDLGYCYSDIRSREEMESYENEAFDKVWLMRTRPVDIPDPSHPRYAIISQIEQSRQEGVRRILTTYNDIPEEGYSDWECGYWNGIMGALRWAMGEEKDFLDT